MPYLSLDTRRRLSAAIATGANNAEIARRYGVHTSTVARVRTHGVNYALPGPRRKAPPEDTPGPVLRCNGCGHTVEHPCRICRDRAAKKRHRRTELSTAPETIADRVARQTLDICRARGDWRVFLLLHGLHEARTWNVWHAIADELHDLGIYPATPDHACRSCGALTTIVREESVLCRACGAVYAV